MANNTSPPELTGEIIQFWQYERMKGLIMRIDAILLINKGIHRTINSQSVDWEEDEL